MGNDVAEECDDGAGKNTAEMEYVPAPPDPLKDALCTVDCKLVKWCGDGDVFPKKEECDDNDAETEDDDECSDECFKPRYVFVTETMTSGNLIGDKPSGLEGADEICQTEADAGLVALSVEGYEWRAWLATASLGPIDRIKDTKWNGFYKIICGSEPESAPFLVAKGWSGLATGNPGLLHAINCDQHGTLYTAMDTAASDRATWSNVAIGGAPKAAGNDCAGWEAANDSLFGQVGDLAQTDSQWTDDEDNFEGCLNSRRLYCVQVKIPN